MSKHALPRLMLLLLILLLLLHAFAIIAQDALPIKGKLYTVRVKLAHGEKTPGAILYKVSDSSVIVMRSVYDPALIEFRYSDIDVLKLNRKGNLLKGLIAGGAAGALGGIIMVNTIPGGLSYMTIPVSAAAGITFAFPGAALGALVCVVPDRIPVKSDYSKFEKYRSNLADYSYTTESVVSSYHFVHRVSVGMAAGITHALGEFSVTTPLSSYTGMNTTGTAFRLNVEYRFSPFLGLDLMMINNMYAVNNTSSLINWNFDAFVISPVLSVNAARKWRFLLSPGIGFATASLNDGEIFMLNGSGLGMTARCAAIYDFSKRWNLSAGMQYLYSNQQYEDEIDGNASCLDFTLGMAYKFGTRGLW